MAGAASETTSNNVTVQISAVQMQRYTDLIYQVTGIRIPLQKTSLLSNRIRRRLRETGVENFEKYFKLLGSLKASDPEWDAFLQEITTHETYLFRDEAQWNWFRKDYLPEIAKDALSGGRPKSLRVWSAAASTGDEAYTIAACIAADLPNRSLWNVQILGTDIGVGALEMAKAGVFGQRAMKLTPPQLREKYFKKLPDNELWQVKQTLSSMTSFRQHNLMDPLREAPFDIIFLKNVLIYFDKDSKQTVIGHVLNALAPGGILVAGAAEGISDLLGSLERIHPWLYRKPKIKKQAAVELRT